MKNILTILILSVVALSVNASNEDSKKESSKGSATMVSTIQGKVIDKTTGEALVGVSVKVDENSVVYTDFEGKFTISIAQPKQKICVSLISYSTTEVEVNRASKEVTIELNSLE